MNAFGWTYVVLAVVSTIAMTALGGVRGLVLGPLMGLVLLAALGAVLMVVFIIGGFLTILGGMFAA